MKENTIVLTMHGSGEAVDHFTITLFNTENGWGRNTVDDYCSNINELKLKDDNWIYAGKVKENEKIRLEKPVRDDFEILCSLDDRAIQEVLREIDNGVLVQALMSAEKNILKAVLRNMSKRAAKMLIDDMKYKRMFSHGDIQEARKKIVNIIRHLEDVGLITVPKFSRKE
jgi:hypothetical protein